MLTTSRKIITCGSDKHLWNAGCLAVSGRREEMVNYSRTAIVIATSIVFEDCFNWVSVMTS